MQTADVVIIGGGIWGLSIAYHLAQSGQAGRVVVLERGQQLASETTSQAAGQIGQIRSDPLLVRGVSSTLDLLDRLRDHHRYDPGLERPGSLHLAQHAERLEAMRLSAQAAHHWGLKTELLTGQQAAARAPIIDPQAVLGALFVHGDGYVDATRYAHALSQAVRDQGIELLRGQRVVRIQGGKGLGRQVETDSRTFSTGEIVVAAGPWTAPLLRAAGVTLPVCAIRLQQARTIPDADQILDHPVVRIPDQSCYLRPEQGGYLFGYFDPSPLVVRWESLANLVTRDVQADRQLVEEARRRMAPVAPIFKKLPVDHFRQGLVTCTPDGRPLVGPVHSLYGVWVATGCGAMGIALSGAVGKWLGQWIARGDPGEDLGDFSPERPGLPIDEDALIARCRDVFANYYNLDRGGTTYGIGAVGQ